jgi:hypothetical protein
MCSSGETRLAQFILQKKIYRLRDKMIEDVQQHH